MTNIELLPMEVIMARAKQKTKIGEFQSQSDFSSVLLQLVCLRCGGLMVKDVSMDLRNSTSELECATSRCVQCGDIVDPVILRNRSIHRQSVATQHQPASAH
jgi:RNase P subunit RPR2